MKQIGGNLRGFRGGFEGFMVPGWLSGLYRSLEGFTGLGLVPDVADLAADPEDQPPEHNPGFGFYGLAFRV